MTFEPLMGYILIDPKEAEKKTVSGILLPESVLEKPVEGTVVACGADLLMGDGRIMVCPVKPGDVVIYKKWGGEEIKVNEKQYKVVRFEDLIGVLR